MVGSIQIGILAACVVLFLPMGMAGWHLRRNKVLFFGAALFITLAVGVHLMPYLPNFPQILLQSFVSPNPSPSNSRKINTPCVSFLHAIEWRTGENGTRTWDWNRGSIPSECMFLKLQKADALDLLNGSRIVVIGDSESRFFTVSLLELLLESVDEIRAELFKRHSNYSSEIGERGIKVDFLWAPYADNITEHLVNFRREEYQNSYPDVIVMGTGLWHMLHLNNASLFRGDLARLQSAAVSILPLNQKNVRVRVQVPHMFWLSLPNLVNRLLNTQMKRERMTPEVCSAYSYELKTSRLLRDDGGPLVLLDMQKLSGGCGESCTDDGMHYYQSVYEASVQIMLNALLIDSAQVPAR